MTYTNPVIFQFHSERPLVWVLIENPHSPQTVPLKYPALIDTGAAHTLIPFAICQRLGYRFESGSNPSSVSGVGSGTVRTYSHPVRLTILSAAITDAPQAGQRAFASFELEAAFVEQRLNFILFGQRDFFKQFRYSQHGHNGWFSLEPIEQP